MRLRTPEAPGARAACCRREPPRKLKDFSIDSPDHTRGRSNDNPRFFEDSLDDAIRPNYRAIRDPASRENYHTVSYPHARADMDGFGVFQFTRSRGNQGFTTSYSTRPVGVITDVYIRSEKTIFTDDDFLNCRKMDTIAEVRTAPYHDLRTVERVLVLSDSFEPTIVPHAYRVTNNAAVPVVLEIATNSPEICWSKSRVERSSNSCK